MDTTYAVTVDIRDVSKITYFRDTLPEIMAIINKELINNLNVSIRIEKMSIKSAD